jgi:hypothetical protein
VTTDNQAEESPLPVAVRNRKIACPSDTAALFEFGSIKGQEAGFVQTRRDLIVAQAEEPLELISQVRIPARSGRRFRRDPGADSTMTRALNPDDSGT